MNRHQVSDFESVQAQLQGMYAEVSALSKRKPDDAINKFKLGLVNEILTECAKLLGQANRPVAGFDRFNDADLPTNSDVLVVLSIHLNALEKLRADNILEDYGSGLWFWKIDGKESGIPTAPPRKLKY